MTHTGIITALVPEAKALIREPVVKTRIPLSSSCSLYICGIGADNARAAVKQLLLEQVRALISLGTCGALSTDLAPGDLVVPTGILSATGEHYGIDPDWHQHAVSVLHPRFPDNLHTGTLLDSARVMETPQQKSRQYQQTGAIAVDMESLAIVKAGAAAGVPVLVVRTVVDPARLAVPNFVIRTCNRYGVPDIPALLLALLKNPLQLASLIALGWSFRYATNSLTRVSQHLDDLIQ